MWEARMSKSCWDTELFHHRELLELANNPGLTRLDGTLGNGQIGLQHPYANLCSYNQHFPT